MTFEQKRMKWITKQISAIRKFDHAGADYFTKSLEEAIELEKTNEGEMAAYCSVLNSHAKGGKTFEELFLF